MVVMVRNTGSDQNNDNNKNVNTNNDKDTNNNVDIVPVREGWVGLQGLCLVGWTEHQQAGAPANQHWTYNCKSNIIHMHINIEHTNIVKAISNREQVMVKGSMDKSASRQGSSSQYQRRFTLWYWNECRNPILTRKIFYCKRRFYLDVASKLSSGIQAALRVLAEAEACLGAKTDPVSVAIVDAAWGNQTVMMTILKKITAMAMLMTMRVRVWPATKPPTPLWLLPSSWTPPEYKLF